MFDHAPSTLGSIPHPEIHRGETVWPTVALGFAVIAGFVGCIVGYVLTDGPGWTLLWLALNTIVIYLSFTLIHEASHRNISRDRVWLNDGLGYIAGLMFHGSYRQFVPIHMRHHAHTNAHGDKDPDRFVVGGITPYNFLRWCFALYFYFAYYMQEMLFKPQNKFAVLGPYTLIFSIYGVALFTGHFHHVALVWGIPAFLAAGITIFLFDYFPHHPHEETGRYTNAQTYRGTVVADAMSMMQNYHIIHHMWPAIPWYKYRKAYAMVRTELLARGHREHSYWPAIISPPDDG